MSNRCITFVAVVRLSCAAVAASPFLHRTSLPHSVGATTAITTAAAHAAAPVPHSQLVIGTTRVTALSANLLRIEPKGPRGFEDRPTFSASGDKAKAFSGIDLHVINTTVDEAILATDTYQIRIRKDSPHIPTAEEPALETDVASPVRAVSSPLGSLADDAAACAKQCEADPTCSSWVFGTDTESTSESETAQSVSMLASASVPASASAPSPPFSSPSQSSSKANCWLLSSFSHLVPNTPGKQVGCIVSRGCSVIARPSFSVYSADGSTLLYDSTADSGEDQNNLLHWPSPLQAAAYPLIDFPRFVVPPWGPTPIPDGARIDPSLQPTNGYDFRNNVNGDTYVFVLGDTLASYAAARAAFLSLCGPVPVLPDWAYGTWFTWWHSYSEAEAKDDISRWEAGKLPIDVWALDMNWRNTSDNQDHFYDHPNTALFANFSEWFEFLRMKRLRTYFNDHPFPVASRGAGGLQTSPQEIAFRYAGLHRWMAAGLTFWWFDHNWKFSIPPPFVNASRTSKEWHGLDNAAWGSHLYQSVVAAVDEQRKAHGDLFYGGRPITLTKFALPDWRPGMDPRKASESPSHHRYPVWWTGDNVPLQASVESMVDQGVHGFKPFVHSDCGGDYRGSAGDLLRWTGHCVFGSILRFHGNDHRPWTYGAEVEASIRHYLQLRYRLLPALIAGGVTASKYGFPLVARGDLFWPELPQSRNNSQYIFLNDTLVAPIFSSALNVSTRQLWLPPGEWQDAWDGRILKGPQVITATQPYERIPFFHRRGGLVVVANDGAMRVDEGDWSTLTAELFPSAAAFVTERLVAERTSHELTTLRLTTAGDGAVTLQIVPGANVPLREWVVRLHMRPGQAPSSVEVDGMAVDSSRWVLLPPTEKEAAATFFPLGGAGALSAPLAGHVLELHLSPSRRATRLEVVLRHNDRLSA